MFTEKTSILESSKNMVTLVTRLQIVNTNQGLGRVWEFYPNEGRVGVIFTDEKRPMFFDLDKILLIKNSAHLFQVAAANISKVYRPNFEETLTVEEKKTWSIICKQPTNCADQILSWERQSIEFLIKTEGRITCKT